MRLSRLSRLSRSSGIDVYILARHDTIYRVYLAARPNIDVTRQYIDVPRPYIDVRAQIYRRAPVNIISRHVDSMRALPAAPRCHQL